MLSHFKRLRKNTWGIQAIVKNNNNLTTNGNNNNNNNNNNNKHLGSIIQFHVYSASLIMRWWVNNKMEMISCVNSKGFADESTWISGFEWTLAERDITFIFFCFFCPYLSAITSKKKALDTEKPEKRKIGIFARRWGKETDIGKGMGGELRVREKNTLQCITKTYFIYT